MHHPRVDKELLSRERVIWLDILGKAEATIENIREMWKKNRRIDRLMFSWPSEHLRANNGTKVTHIVSFEVPKRMNTHEAAVLFVKETKSYAFMVVEQEDSELKILVESFHGTKCWHIPITRHGDVNVLDKSASSSEDTECFGILWRRDSRRS